MSLFCRHGLDRDPGSRHKSSVCKLVRPTTRESPSAPRPKLLASERLHVLEPLRGFGLTLSRRRVKQ
jgi:hypothetical protein